MLIKTVLKGELMFPGNYLSAIEFKGRDVTLAISGVTVEKLQRKGGKSEPKPVLSFERTRKKLVLNKTNASAIAEMYGPVAEKWVGQRVTFYPTTDKFGRETVDAIRVRVKKSPSPESEPTWSDDDVVDEQLPDDILAASEEQQGAEPAEGDDPQPPESMGPIETYAEFVERMDDVAAGVIDEKVVAACYALLRLQTDVNKNTAAAKDERGRIVDAAKAGKFDWTTGKIK